MASGENKREANREVSVGDEMTERERERGLFVLGLKRVKRLERGFFFCISGVLVFGSL